MSGSGDGALFSVFSGPGKQRPAGADSSDDDSEFGGGDAANVLVGTAGSRPPKRPRVDAPPMRSRPASFEIPVKPAANGSNCTHDVSLPADKDPAEFIYPPPESNSANGETPDKSPAKTYPFPLDAFQRDAVQALEAGHSVLVSAHTSAGKTAVAEYAIALALKAGQRVIYTSPIKALSNQKYRELAEEFADVGLMTGDTTINPSASCLVMTTEILRSMIYKGSEVVRELAWVIFDEVHKMSDRERGVVWEETIILLPEKIKFVFLSATIPNAREFAQWVTQVKGHPTHAIYTGSRPVPLQHYLYPEGAEGVYLVVDEEGTFREDNFGKAIALLPTTAPGKNDRGTRAKKPNAAQGPSACYKVVKMIMEKGYAPAIIFAFSRRDIESMAVQMSKLDFNSEEEKELVEQVFHNAIESLAVEDQKLPQITHALPLLKNGVGIHHSGLLPILKEIVEILFAEGLIKALFATETFSMGLNMPAKTVVFSGIRKFDGEELRFVSGGEYIQMSGRAGRRGLDKRGLVILMCTESLEPDTAKDILKGQADPLRSTFRLKYNMLLNLLRSEEADPEYVIKRSFAQFQADGSLPENEIKLAALQEKRDTLVLPPNTPDDINEQRVLDDIKARSKLDELRKKIRKYISAPTHASRFLQPGRLVRIRDESNGDNFGWGAVIRYTKQSKDGFARRGGRIAPDRFMVDMLLLCVPQGEATSGPKWQAQKRPRPVLPGEDEKNASWLSVPCTLETVEAISAIRIHLPTDLRPNENRAAVGRSLSKVFENYPGSSGASIPLLDPIEDQGITEPAFLKLYKKVEAKTLVVSGPESLEVKCKAADVDRAVLVAVMTEKIAIGEEISVVKRAVQVGQGLILTAELKSMKRVLRRLGFVNSENIVEVKGRTACEINTADELVVTQLMFDGSFNEMEPAVLVSLLSCFVYDERADEEVELSPVLSGAFELVRSIASTVADVTIESKLPMEKVTYVDGFNPSAMKIIHAWCSGKSFADICDMTPMFEGSIIRILRRLEELLRQLGMAAKGIGNTDLQEKFEAGTLLLRRGVAFQASLYL